MHEANFIQAIRASPSDDTCRLVYADWLTEQGDVRGEFLRVALALKTGTEPEPEVQRLRKAIQQLRPLVSANWLAEVCREVAEDDIREAVLRESFQSRLEPLVFFGVEDGSPSWYLLDRLAASKPPFKPASSMPAFMSQNLGRYGAVLLQTDRLRWIADCEWEVESSCFFDDYAIASGTYLVRLQGAAWVASRCPQDWASPE